VVAVVRHRSARVLAALACGGLVAGVAGLAVSGPASGTSSFNLSRLAGADRYATSALVAEQAFSTAPTVILATGANYPDALAASFLAGAEQAPILLTTPDLPLSSSTQAALSTLKTSSVIILGGTAAVSEAEQTQLSQTASSAGGTITVSRISGPTRYDTMEAVDTAPGTTVGTFNGEKTAFIATGEDFPDALGAGPIAYAEHFPIILTPGQSLAPQAAATLTDLGIQQVLILGGTSAVSSAVESAINAMGIPTLARFAGVDRSQTSTLLADYAIDNFGFKDTAVNVASGDEAYGGADALSSGPLGGTEDPVPTIITDAAGVPGQTVAFASEHEATLTGGFAIGGTGPLTDADLIAIEQAGQGSTTATTVPGTPTTNSAGGGASGTTGAPTGCGTATTSGGSGSASGGGETEYPSLSSVEFVSTVGQGQESPGHPAGTTLAFTFAARNGEGVNGAEPQKTDFELIPYQVTSNSPVIGPPGPHASLQATFGADLDQVDVLFPIYSQDQLDLYTVANVLPGAVTTPGNGSLNPPVPSLSNPDGDAPIGRVGGIEAGHTDGADLVSAANLRQEIGGVSALDVTFDCAVQTVNAGTGTTTATATTGFHLILADDTNLDCTAPDISNSNASGLNAPGGSGTDVLTITCPDATSGEFVDTPLVPADAVRLYVAPDSVQDAASGTILNPLEAVDVSGGSSETGALEPLVYPGSPDLTSVEFQANITIPPSTTPVDEVTYIFDKPLLSGFNPVAFGVYYENGTESSVTPSVVFASGSSDEVVATFPAGTLIGAVGANVTAGAVTGTAGNSNLPDSAPGTGPSPTGLTTTTNLLSASAGADEVTFTFATAVSVGSAAGFHLYANDSGGTELNGMAGSCTTGLAQGATDTQLVCSYAAPISGTVELATIDAGAVTSAGGPNTSVFSVSV